MSHLNGLPDRPDGDAVRPGERVEPTACALMLRPAYRIVLVYGDRPAAIVDIRPNCGSASRGGTVRSLSTLPDLLEFWPPPATPPMAR